ncbi:MAG: hypothetical protein PHC61_11980, partial [Chitinivibrionales bacterium]|nr:hypothetical protein [Chitinivibrionales bacterium]
HDQANKLDCEGNNNQKSDSALSFILEQPQAGYRIVNYEQAETIDIGEQCRRRGKICPQRADKTENFREKIERTCYADNKHSRPENMENLISRKNKSTA